MTALPVVPTRTRSSLPVRVGVVLAVLQAVAGLALVLSDFGTEMPALAVNVLTVLVGVLTSALAVPAWRGVRWAAGAIAVGVVLFSLTGLFALFIPGVPPGAVVAAGVGIALAVLTAVLLLARPGRAAEPRPIAALTDPAQPSTRTSVLLRIGVVLASLQGVGNLVLGIAEWSGDTFGQLVCSVLVGGGVAALGLSVPAWRGMPRGAALLAVVTVVASLTALPAFFVPGVPAAAVIAAAVGIVLAVVTAVLLLVPRRG